MENLVVEKSSILYWLTLVAVFFSAVSGAMEAGNKRFDLFGVVIVAIAAALGGGSLRDVLLDRNVFWVVNQDYLILAIIAAVLIFVVARWQSFSRKIFLWPDAMGLASFTIAGTLVALVLDTPWLVASFMGVITGVMGGVFRDVLCNEEPIVFGSTLYATPAWMGALVLILLLEYKVDINIAVSLAGGLIFIVRLLAIYFQLSLPKFRAKE